MTFDDFMEVLGIKEEYQIKDRLMQILLSEEKNTFFENLIERGLETSKDAIRDIFESELANRKRLKQDYTPECLCKLISKLCGEQSEILDICSGVGSLSIANISDQTRFRMEEISDVSIYLLLLNMAIRNTDAEIVKKNVLTKETYETYKVTSSDRFSTITKEQPSDNHKTYQCIVSNPPYSLKWEPMNDERYYAYGLAPKSKADYAFVLDALYRLEENGTAFIILPHGVLFRGNEEGKIRKAMCYDGVIDTIISLPENMFTNTGIQTIIMCLKKGRRNRDIMFIDSSKNFDKVGKYNVLNDDHINQIVETYRSKQDKPKYSKLVKYEEIEYNDFNLNVPRYVDTSEDPEHIDFGKTIEDMITLENSIHDIDIELIDMLKDLRGPDSYEYEKQRMIEHLNKRYYHDVSKVVERINQFICTDERFNKYRMVKLLDIATVERSKKGKIYKAGSSLIQLSATRGQMQYMNEDGKVDAKYAVIIPKKKSNNTKYLYFIIRMAMPGFLQVYQTGLNVAPDVFRYMEIMIHDDIQLQNEIVTMFNKLEELERNLIADIERWKDVKKFHLDGMFPNERGV